MPTLAKHIQTALAEGPDAGLEAWMAAPSSRIHTDRWDKIVGNGRRSHATMVKNYCRVFADELASQPARTRVQKSRQTDDVQSLAEQVRDAVFAQLAEVLGNGTPEAVDEEEFDSGDAIIEALMVEYDVSESAARKMHENGIEPTEVTENVPATVVERTRGTAKAKAARKAPPGAITAQEAWEALGSGETFKPNDPGKEANNGQLYRLNVQGLLKLNT